MNEVKNEVVEQAAVQAEESKMKLTTNHESLSQPIMKIGY